MMRPTPPPPSAEDTAESDERDTRTRLPTRVAGRRPAAIQRWTVRTVTPSSSPTSRGVSSFLMSLLSQFEAKHEASDVLIGDRIYDRDGPAQRGARFAVKADKPS